MLDYLFKNKDIFIRAILHRPEDEPSIEFISFYSILKSRVKIKNIREIDCNIFIGSYDYSNDSLDDILLNTEYVIIANRPIAYASLTDNEIYWIYEKFNKAQKNVSLI